MFDGQFTTDVQDTLYPELWDGCVGVFAPMLGITGGTLFNWTNRTADATNTGLGASDWTFSAVGTAISYNGTTRYTSLPSTSVFSFGTGDFTLSQWVYMRSFSTTAITLGKDTDSSRQWNFGPGAGVGGQVLQFNNIAAGVDPATGATTITTNTWHHIAAVRRSGLVTVWLNGKADGSKTITTNYSTTSQIRIGQREFPGFPSGFDGLIAETLIHTRALTADELCLLAKCPGAMYIPQRRPMVSAGASFNPAWAARCNQYVGLGAI